MKKNPLMHQVMAGESWDPGEDDEEAAISPSDGEALSLVALRALAREALARGGNVFTHMPV